VNSPLSSSLLPQDVSSSTPTRSQFGTLDVKATIRMAAGSCEHHDGERTFSSHQKLVHQTKCFHERLPGIRRIPFRSIAIIALIALANIMVWAAAAIVLVR
jgi:hypothetical protein